ncbi:MAG: hypothetical protein ACHQ0Y_02100 [Thermodesulfovibrionales bacterium]
MFLRNVKIIFGVFLVLLVVHSVAYAGPGTQITLGGDIRYRGYDASSNHSDLPAPSINIPFDFYDARIRLSLNANVTPDTSGSVKVKIDNKLMPSTATLDGNNGMVLDFINLLPADSHVIKIDGINFDPSSLPSNSPVTGGLAISGTNIPSTTFDLWYGITGSLGCKGSAVLSRDLMQAIIPHTYYNGKSYDLRLSIDSNHNFQVISHLNSYAKAGLTTSNFAYHAADGDYFTAANASYLGKSYYFEAKYNPLKVGFGFDTYKFGSGNPASVSNASNFAGATSVAGHILDQAKNYHLAMLDLSLRYTSDQTFSCGQGGIWKIAYNSPYSIQFTFDGCNGLFQNTTVYGQFWLGTSGAWYTDHFRARSSYSTGSYDITYNNLWTVGTQSDNFYTGTMSGMTTGVIVNGPNSLSANFKFANVNFNTVFDPTAMTNTLNVQSGHIFSDCPNVNAWFMPVIYNRLSDSQGIPKSGTFYINSMNGGDIIGTIISPDGLKVTSGVTVVGTHPTEADLETACSIPLTPTSGFQAGTYTLDCPGGCGESNPSTAIVTVNSSTNYTNIMWSNFGGATANFTATGNMATLTGTPPPLFGTPATSLTITLSGTQWIINGTDPTGSCTSPCNFWK